MTFARRLACDPERNICKTLVRTCSNLYALNIATFNLVIDRVSLVGQIYDFSILCDFKVNLFCTLCQISLWRFLFRQPKFSVR